MRDSYELFFSRFHIDKEQFFDFGLNETIFATFDKAKEGWEDLKQRIKNNGQVYIRGFGRNSNASHLYKDFYSRVLSNENVEIDPTNNQKPANLIRDMTKCSKDERSGHEPIRNYQISHVFGRTKNIFTFTAPWNIVYQPKIIDPFTGHEAKGEMVSEYKTMLQKKTYVCFEALIEEYNQNISDNDFRQRIEKYFKDISNSSCYSQTDIDKLVKSVREELTPITA